MFRRSRRTKRGTRPPRRAGARGLGRDELGAGIHAHRVENPAGSRVEEGLGKLEILPVSGEAREECLHRPPQRDIRDALAEERFEIPDRGVEPVAIELEALESIGPRPVPVALRKARRRPARDLAERARVLLVRAKQPLGAGLGALLAHRRTTAALRRVFFMARNPSAGAGTGTLGAHAPSRNRRPSERREVDALQRPHEDQQSPGRELPVLYDRAERGHRDGARPAPRAAREDRDDLRRAFPPRSSSWTSRAS